MADSKSATAATSATAAVPDPNKKHVAVTMTVQMHRINDIVLIATEISDNIAIPTLAHLARQIHAAFLGREWVKPTDYCVCTFVYTSGHHSNSFTFTGASPLPDYQQRLEDNRLERNRMVFRLMEDCAGKKIRFVVFRLGVEFTNKAAYFSISSSTALTQKATMDTLRQYIPLTAA
jgi:hypothetical protein